MVARIVSLLLISFLPLFCLNHHCSDKEKITSHPHENGNAIRRWAYLLGTVPYSEQYLNRALTGFDYVVVTGFTFAGDGRIQQKIPLHKVQSLRALARHRGITLYPLISLKSVIAGITLLTDNRIRAGAIENLKKLVTRYQFGGIHIDFEYLHPRYAVHLATFLEELRSAMPGITLSMALFPQVDFPAQYSGFHNIEVIGPHLDEIVLMCYDYYRPGTKAGPVTDIQWAEKNILKVLQHMKPSQIWLGVPAYGYAWDERDRTTVITARRGVKLAQRYGGTRHKSGTLYFVWPRNGNVRVYLSDATTRQRMEELARRYSLKGTALWRLGFEERE
jgi:spore germination protein YaaH